MLPLTLITSFYGMNILDLPMAYGDMVYWLMWGSIVFMLMVYIVLKNKGKF
jgi:Mg2+ and Co2+ transporter CorA